MRSTSFRQRQAYEANVHNVNEDSIDCGIKMLKCCNTPKWRKLGTTKAFLAVLILLAIVQGISEKFITISAQQAALEYDFNSNVIDWLLVSNGIIQGIVAIFIAFWGYRIHKITWLCGMIIFQSFTCLLIILLTQTERNSSPAESTFNLHVVKLLCSYQTSARFSLNEIPDSITTLIGLFILQVGISYGFIAFYTLGLTYLDDNAQQHNAPALIGGALAGRYLGFVLGNVLSMFTYEVFLGWWLGWAIISPILLILAIIIGLFPRRMIDTVVRQAADTIVETATNSSQLSLSRTKFLSDITFISSIGRIVRNKILLLNICGTVFIQTALINFTLQEKNYVQSRFLIPVDDSQILNNEWTSRTLSKFIQPLIIALAILIGGLIIAKATPSPRKIVIWNLITALIVCLLFIGFIFIECSHNSIAGVYGNKLHMPYCSRGCICDSDIRFTPVCSDKSSQTHFSPCHAGCLTDQVINGQRIFGNCSCGLDPDLTLVNDELSTASEGACGYENCQKMWIIFQILSAFGAVCIGSRLVGKLLISIRSVLKQDTSIALGLELTVVGLLAYIPGKIAYDYIADMTCQFWSQNNSLSLCYLHNSQTFGNYVNILSAVLSLIAVILEFIILFVVQDLDLYGDQENLENAAVELQPMTRPVNESNAEVTIPEPNQSLLPEPVENTSENAQPIISAPIQTTNSSTLTHSGIVTGIKQSMSSRFVSTTNSKSPTSRYSPVYKQSDSHIEELNIRLKKFNEKVQINLVKPNDEHLDVSANISGDINPSVGSDTEKDSDVNIQQLESSVSSLSGVQSGSSTVNSPERLHKRHKDKHQPVNRFETDF